MKIAIKGIIGSGKSTASEYISNNYGYEIFNCDKVVHELYETNSSLTTEICNAFALESFSRKELGNIVFNDVLKLKQLEEMVFPYIIEEFNKCSSENIVLDCHIIDKIDVEYDFAIVCCADIDTLMHRVLKRDGRTEEEVKKIIKMQPNTYVAKKRTWAIDTTENMEMQIDKIMGGINDSNR